MTALFGESSLVRAPEVVAPGAVHLPGLLPEAEQARIVRRCREIGRGPVPFRHPLVGAHPMSVSTVSVGWHWTQSGYSRRAVDVNGAPVLPVPEWMVALARHAIAAAAEVLAHAGCDAHGSGLPARPADFRADAGLVNFYAPTAKMGMHQDKHEVSVDPIVSLSIGDACTFRFGNTSTRTKPYRDITLASGDGFVFGGASRFAFHGVPRIHPDSAPPGCGLDAGRLNITLRRTGLPARDT